MPIDYTRYPDNWKEIRSDILDRAYDCCENCGVPNMCIIGCYKWNNARYIIHHHSGSSNVLRVMQHRYSKNELDNVHMHKPIKVVLTVAHLDQDVKNNDYKNLAALCQRCHFKHDRKDNLKKSARTRKNKK